MIGRLKCVALDCPDIRQLAAFYQRLLGGEVNLPDHGDPDWDWATLHTPSGTVLAFQQAADHRPPRWPDPDRPQQFHLDIGVNDLDAAEREALELGATLLDPGDGVRDWRVYADPAGHPFCLVDEGVAQP